MYLVVLGVGLECWVGVCLVNLFDMIVVILVVLCCGVIYLLFDVVYL